MHLSQIANISSSSSLPTVLASKCDGTTCTTLTSDLDVVKECFKGKSSELSVSNFVLNFTVCVSSETNCSRSLELSLHGNLFRLGWHDVALRLELQVHLHHLHHPHHQCHQPWWVPRKDKGKGRDKDTSTIYTTILGVLEAPFFASRNQVWFHHFFPLWLLSAIFDIWLDRSKKKVSIRRRRFELIHVQTDCGHWAGYIYNRSTEICLNRTARPWREKKFESRAHVKLCTKLRLNLNLLHATKKTLHRDSAQVRILTRGVQLCRQWRRGQRLNVN